MVIAPARRAGDPGSNPGPDDSLKLIITVITCLVLLLYLKKFKLMVKALQIVLYLQPFYNRFVRYIKC